MTFEVTVIGSGAAMPMAGKYHSSHVINIHDQFYLLDCGEGTIKGMLESKITPQKIKAVFISHLHGDHVYGIFPLIDTLSLSQRSSPLKVFAPAPLKEMIDCIQHTLYGNSYGVEFYEVDTLAHTIVYENESIEVWSIPMLHRIPAAGYLFREKNPELNIRKDMISKYDLNVEQILEAKSGNDIMINHSLISNNELTYSPFIPRSYAYCTDTVFSEKTIERVKGIDLLYHEATFAAADSEMAYINGHSTTVQAAKIALDSGVKRLLIGHFSARYKDTSLLVEEAKKVFPETEEAVQGKTYAILLDKNNF